MDTRRLCALYDKEVRAKPTPRPGFSVVRRGGVTRISGPYNFVTAWDVGADGVAAAVADQVADVRSRGEGLMWRIYDHDGPPQLAERLKEAGFEPNPQSTLMFLDLEACEIAGGDADVRQVSTMAELEDFIATGEQAFGAAEPWRRAAYASRLADPNLGLYVAYVGGEAAASARLDTAPGESFGQLYGGGVAPKHRGKGLYRALVAIRAAHSRLLGKRYLMTEARETSRPILERLGFFRAGRETTWVLSPESPNP